MTARRLTIAEVAEEFGVTHRALRFYEAKGILAPDREGARRLYDPAQVDRLRIALDWRRFGFTLDEIAELIALGPLAAGRARFLEMAGPKLDALRRQREEIDLAIPDLEKWMSWGRETSAPEAA